MARLSACALEGGYAVLTLLRRYWNEMVSYEGGMALLLMDGLLLVPLIMAAFFYPVEVLMGLGALLLVTLIAYEGYRLWRKRHGHAPTPQVRM
jgi:hypothetical protein